jgi:DNA-binding MarR family transcriptional regulator
VLTLEKPVLDREALVDRVLTLRPTLLRCLATKVFPTDLREELRSVTLHQMEALRQIYPDGLTMGDLARALEITDGSAAVLSDRLVKQGLAVRQPDPNDRRVVWLAPSDRARVLFERFRAVEREMVVSNLQTLDDTRLAAFLDVLEQLATANPIEEGSRCWGMRARP